MRRNTKTVFGKGMGLLFLVVGVIAIMYGIFYATLYRDGLRVDGEVVLLVEEGTVTSNGMEVCIVNPKREYCYFDSEYRIERKTPSGWEELPYKNAPVWDLFLHGLLKGQERTYSIDWSRMYGSLEPGLYRFVKEFDLGPYGVEFTIS